MDYQLTENEKKILDVLDLKEYKSQMQVIKDSGVTRHYARDVLNSLMKKGLANYKLHPKTIYWYAT